MMATIGLLPPWLQSYSCFDHTGRVFCWYAKKFGLTQSSPAAKKLMASLPTAMQHGVDRVLPECTLENLACKNFQHSNGRREIKRDIHYVGPPLVMRNDRDNGIVLSINGERIELDSPSLISIWYFGDELCTMVQIAENLQLPLALPGVRTLHSLLLPGEARSRPDHSVVEFEIPDWYTN